MFGLGQIPSLSWSSEASLLPWGDELTGGDLQAQNKDSKRGRLGLSESWICCLRAVILGKLLACSCLSSLPGEVGIKQNTPLSTVTRSQQVGSCQVPGPWLVRREWKLAISSNDP